MKTLFSIGVVAAFLGLAVASTYAQTQTTTSSSTSYIETSKLVGKPVRSSQGEEIGTIKDVVIDRSTGCMAYTVLSTGGEGGGRVAAGGGKMVAVPWSVYSPQSDVNTYTVTVDRERIFNAPVFDYARIEEYSRPDYISNVYSYYGVSPGAGVGVGVSGGASTTTTGAATTTTGTTTTGATTGTGAGAAARAGATASPAGGTSPEASAPPGRSPMGTASPTGRGSPRPRATAATSPHTRGGRPHETTSPGTRDSTDKSATDETRGTREGRQETTSPSGRRETESRPDTSRSENERAPSEGATTGEKTKGSTRERSRSREAATPPERPQE
jgi:sporulation protein YlmC with PRC-barrel domain